jgi:hypothetical protein
VHQKYKSKRLVKNLINFVALSNTFCIRSENDDRRLCVLDANILYAKNYEILAKLHKAVNDPQVQYAFANCCYTDVETKADTEPETKHFT